MRTIFMLAFTIYLLSLSSAAQSPFASAKQQSLPPRLVHATLREPDGLLKLSEMVGGDIVLDEPEERWGESGLSDLMSQSTLVARARVLDRESHLVSSGDEISTTLQLAVLHTWKGDASATQTIDVPGGQVTLANGRSASIHTLVSDSLSRGSTYVLFLSRREDGLWSVVGEGQGVLAIDAGGQKLSPVEPIDGRGAKLSKDVSDRTVASFEQSIGK